MTVPPQPNPLSAPDAWNLVAEGYVAEVMPLFERYAARALELAALPAQSAVLDVAAGPGTLSLLAAQAGHRVSAVDFSPSMIQRLRAHAKERKLAVDAQLGDGQALPFPDASFEGAFSMFGLMFFPDRLLGFREILRVLKPGGRCVVSSWTPMETVPALKVMAAAMREALPGLPFGNNKAPLGELGELRDEMREAGFDTVDVQQVMFSNSFASARAFWDSFARGGAPCALLRHKLGDYAFSHLSHQVVDGLERKLGRGPVEVPWTANFGLGTRG